MNRNRLLDDDKAHSPFGLNLRLRFESIGMETVPSWNIDDVKIRSSLRRGTLRAAVLIPILPMTFWVLSDT